MHASELAEAKCAHLVCLAELSRASAGKAETMTSHGATAPGGAASRPASAVRPAAVHSAAGRPAATTEAWAPPDLRRWLQLGLAGIWLLDGVLQYQPVMFGRSFSQMLAASAAGSPVVVSGPVHWAAAIIARQPTAVNIVFATLQVALGLGIAWRRTARPALAASVAWALAVWWLGEGLGGVLTGSASVLDGAPGPALLYALAALLLWPPRRAVRAGGAGVLGGDGTARDELAEEGTAGDGTNGGELVGGAVDGVGRFVSARDGGSGGRAARGARLAWVLLWGSMAAFTVQAGNRTAQGLHDSLAAMAAGEPDWLATANREAATLVANRGLPVSIALAVLFALIATGIFLPPPGVRVTLVAATVVSLIIGVVGEDLGEILAGGATDPGSGPLLVLIALTYWPLRPPRPGRQMSAGGP